MAVKPSKIMLADGFPTLPDFEEMETGEATMDDVYDTQGIITHVQKTLKADKAYNTGDQFVYDGKLYAATGSIAKDATIVLTGAGANVELSDDIVTQIKVLMPTKTLIYTATFVTADFDSSTFSTNDQFSSDERAALFASDIIYVEVYYKGDNGKHSLISCGQVYMDDVTQAGDNNGWMQTRFGYNYFTGKIVNFYLQGDNTAFSANIAVNEDFYQSMGESNEFIANVYKIS